MHKKKPLEKSGPFAYLASSMMQRPTKQLIRAAHFKKYHASWKCKVHLFTFILHVQDIGET